MPERNPLTGVGERDIVSCRRFAQSRADLWRAWSEPGRLARWWGPAGFANTFAECDFRPGGHWRFVMRGPNGAEHRNHNVFVELVAGERVVLDHLGEPAFRLFATFADDGGGTRMTFRMHFADAATCAAVARYAVACNEQNFDRLAAELTGVFPVMQESSGA